MAPIPRATGFRSRIGSEIAMRFSLATLLLLVLWIGAGMWVWAWREPWRYDQTVSRIDFGRYVPPKWFENGDQFDRRHFDSPDCERGCNVYVSRDYHYVIYDKHAARSLFEFDGVRAAIGFLDDNNFAFRLGPWSEMLSPDDRCEIFYRRFPEWWWGHFYRPEVWLFIGLSAALLWRFVRWRRKSAA
jgi:hypothetical protein